MPPPGNLSFRQPPFLPRTSFGTPYSPPNPLAFGSKVGHFVKSIGAAPSSQSITGLGFQPKAVFFWTMGATADNTFATEVNIGTLRLCIGVATSSAAAEQFCGAAGESTATGSARKSTARAIALLNGAGSVNSECLLTSMDSDGFSLNWTTNDITNAQIINYLALGGTDVQGRVLTVQPPNSTGNFSITGTGFTPNIAFLIGCGAPMEFVQGPLATMRMGVTVSTTKRWAFVATTTGAASGAATRINRSDRSNISTTPGSLVLTQDVDLVSFNSDGATFNNNVASVNPLGVLCLKVPFAMVGTTTKPTIAAPATTGVTGLGFAPAVVLLAGVQAVTNASGTNDGARVGISAFTPTTAESAAWSVPPAPVAITYAGITKTGKSYVKVDSTGPAAINAEANFVSMDGNGFTLNWTTNDVVATEFNYLAIGGVPLRRSRRRRKVIKPRPRAQKPRGAFRRRTL